MLNLVIPIRAHKRLNNTLRKHLCNAFIRQGIGTLIADIAGVPLDP